MKTSKVLGGRYILLEKVGDGGMAIVYKATDTILGRTVAIKLLRAEYSSDPDFVKNFDNEALAAASLSHANVVNIFDVGKDGDDHYIVMEFVDGQTLKEIIKERAPLEPEEAVNIAKQICDALEHAHSNQLIHRDIKPHNIMIDKTGKVKVTDFGIARAVTASTMTYQSESVMGSVHYFSPEQARGGVATEASDIYSLGIVMYEMVTGKLPYSGESPISVAMKHIQDRLTPPTEYNHIISDNLENIILRSLAKDPLQRYKSTKEISSDLKYALSEVHYVPRVISQEDDIELTKMIPIVKARDLAESVRQPQMSLSRDVTSKRVINLDQEKDKITPLEKDSTEGNKREADDKAKGEMVYQEEESSLLDKAWFKIALVSSLLLVIALLSVYIYSSFMDILQVPDAEIPAVEEMTVDEAILAFAEEGFDPNNISIREQINDKVEAGKVFKQSPNPNTQVKIDYSPINLYVSLGKEQIKMPEVTGMSSAKAKLILDQNNIKFEIKEDNKGNIPSGEVYDQAPHAGVDIVADEIKAIIYVSKGIKMVPMPNLLGRNLTEAEAILRENQLVRGTVHEESNYAIPENQVTKQSPYKENDMVAVGEKIDLWVSSGPPDESRTEIRTIKVQPSSEGSQTEVIIKVNDAKGMDRTAYKENISQAKEYIVEMTLSPDGIGVIEIYLDGVFVDSEAVSY